MKKITFLGVVGAALVGLALPAAAGPHGGGFGGGGHFGGGGRVGGFVGGGSRAAPAPGFYSGGFRSAPAFRGAYFTGRTVDRPAAPPRYYYGGNRMATMQPRGFTRSVGRPANPNVGRFSATTRQPNRVSPIAAQNRASRIGTTATRQPNRIGSVAGRNRDAASRTSTAANRRTAANREAFVKNHASEHHNGNWHRDWDRHHAHFHNHKVFVFVNGFWWGLDPGIYPSYAYDYPYDSYDYPYDNNGYSPYDYSYGNPYGYYNYAPYNDDDAYSDSGQSAVNSTVSAAQSELAKLGYYNGAIDGTIGDQTEAALANYQEDNNLSVTGTLDTATLQSLGVK
ncbi:MAG TPA: peptidoglycan-binding domain-containing protein [Candidatus Udaeobacter sp.]